MQQYWQYTILSREQMDKYILWSPLAYNTTGSKPHHADHRPNSKWHRTAGAQTAKVWQEYSGLEEAPAICPPGSLQPLPPIYFLQNWDKNRHLLSHPQTFWTQNALNCNNNNRYIIICAKNSSCWTIPKLIKSIWKIVSHPTKKPSSHELHCVERMGHPMANTTTQGSWQTG